MVLEMEAPSLDSPLTTKFPLSVENFVQLQKDLEENGHTSRIMNGDAKHSSGVKATEAETPSTSTSSRRSSSSQKDIFRNCTLFENVHYLGCSKIDDPSNEAEMLKLMQFLDQERTADAVSVTLAIPHTNTGNVTLSDSTGAILTSFSVNNIRFCVRGKLDSAQKHCFCISFTHHPATGESVHQCHVFRSAQPDTAGRALYCFSQAFQNTGPSAFGADQKRMEFKYEAFLEIRENEGTSKSSPHYVLCPQQSNTIKLRRDRQKKLIVQLKQVSGPPLTVTKCFGMLLAAGRNLRHSDMQLLDMESMRPGALPSVYVITAIWDPRVHQFEVLNTETPRETRVFMTVAVDVILAEVSEPIRFSIEAKARVFHQHERFYKLPRVAVHEGYSLVLERPDENGCDASSNGLVFVSVESEAERLRAKQRLGRSPSRMPTQLLQPAGDDESDCDEPLLSGSGKVNRDCPEELMTQWTTCVEQWRTSEDGTRPDCISSLILGGVPDVMRGEVWQLLAKVNLDEELVKTYHLLLGKECPSEQVIMRDIHRTFPAHDHFKLAGGEGQESLYKISKAYSLYDEEVSYCQGLSFLAASLLLHMPKRSKYDSLFARCEPDQGSCKLCDKVVPWSKNTGTNALRHHLQQTHCEVYKKFMDSMEEEQEKRKKEEKEKDASQLKLPFISVPRKMSVFETQSDDACTKFDKEVGKLICTAALPLSFVETEGFRNFISAVLPSQKLKSRTHMTEKVIPSLKRQLMTSIERQLEQTDWLALTIDTWSSAGNKHSLISVTGHWLNKASEPCFGLLSSKAIQGSHTGVALAEHVRDALAELRVDPKKIVAIVRDGASNVDSMGKNLRVVHFHCMAHNLQLCVKDALAALPEMDPLVEKLKKIVRKLNKSRVCLDQFKDIQNSMELPDRMLTKHTEVRWNSLYTMVSRFLTLKAAVMHFLVDHKENVSRLHFSTIFPRFPPLTDADWILMRNVCDLLRPLAEATESVQQRGYSTMSTIIPLARMISFQLDRFSPPIDMTHCHGVLVNSITNRTAQYYMSDPMKLATILDPRFKNAFFHASYKAELLEAAAKTLMPSEKITSSDAEKAALQQNDQEDSSIFHKFLATEGIRSCASPDVSEFDIRHAVQKEIELYLSNVPDIKTNPINFWAENGAMFPTLRPMALKYLCVPASSAESERVFSAAGLILTNRRSRLSPDNLDSLLFCHQNLRSNRL